MEWLQGRNKNNQTMPTDLMYNKRFVLGPNNIAHAYFVSIKQILRIKTCAVYEHHACANECQSFPFLYTSKWKDHLNDKCSICEMHRFHLLKVTTKGSITTRRRKFYVFGIGSAIKRYLAVACLFVYFSRP